jgi:hypothetical protein
MGVVRNHLQVTALVAGTPLWLAVTLSSPAVATAITGACQPTKTSFIASDATNITTSSATPTVVPDTRVRFKQGGNNPSCVIVEFSANALASGAQLMQVRAVLDGTSTGVAPNVNGQILTTGDSGDSMRRLINVIFPSVAPGAHTIRMYFWSVNGGTVELDFPWTIVHSSP